MRDYAEVQRMLLWDLEPYLTGNPFMSSDMDGKQVSALALAGSFYKKLCPLGTNGKADQAALEKFLRINDSIPVAPFDFPVDDEQDATFWDYFKNSFRDALQFEVEGTNYDLSFIRETMTVGPGSAQKAKNTDFASKLFEGPVSTTSEFLIPLYRSALSETGLWAEAELLRSSRFPFVSVKGGKVFFAPKNAEISRTCCTPSNLGLVFQMTIGAFMEQRLGKYFGISLSTQPDKNRELARIGSIDGSFGTIDLVSASDSVSWQLVLKLLEDSFLKRVLMECRDEFAVLPDGSSIALNMTSTMGNGFTFPLQTLIFASAVKAVYEMKGLRPTTVMSQSGDLHPSRVSSQSNRTLYGVFGDDIVVEKSTYDTVCRMLKKLGFEVNDAKSFNTGDFRESCGEDWFRGRNVRGIYITSLETPQQVYSAINRLLRWSARSGIPLVRTISSLRRLVRNHKVPPSASDDSGIKVPFRATRPSVSNRYWFRFRFYKRLGVRVEASVGPTGLEVMSPAARTQISGSLRLEDSGFRARKVDRRVEESSNKPRKSGPRFVERSTQPEYWNPVGLEVAFLGGYIRSNELSLTESNLDDFLMGKIKVASSISRRERRGGRPRYKLVNDEIPWWDWPGNTGTKTYTGFEFDEEYGGVTPREYSAWESTVLATCSFE
jgi:hypothetical protein